ncbi:MAG: cobalamin-binding protein [Firmicutes bacterium]|nr:cobalamin-binding protein [Bacillota bacterium]
MARQQRMMRKGIVVGLGLFLALTIRAGEFPLQLTDQFGRVLTLEKLPMRIVSGSPGNTEILFALGLEDRIVGVTDWCDYPLAAQSKPKIGNITPLNLEKVLALHPDLVLACNLNGKDPVENLTALGVPTFALNPVSFADLSAAIRLVGRLTATEVAAEELASALETALRHLPPGGERSRPKPKVFIAIGTELTDLWTAGTGTFLDEAVTTMGWENIAGELGFSWGQLSLEYILAQNPAVILTELEPEVFAQDPFFCEVAAVKQNQVFRINIDIFSRPGPRLVTALQDLARLGEQVWK